jgi:hypothetical protein
MDNGPIIFENVITALKSDDLKNRNWALKLIYKSISNEEIIEKIWREKLKKWFNEEEIDKLLKKINNKYLIHAKSGLKTLEEKFDIDNLNDEIKTKYLEFKEKLWWIVSSEEQKQYFENHNINQILWRINVALIQSNFTE